MDIQEILKDWYDVGLTIGEMKTKHNLSDEQVFALWYVGNLSITEIADRFALLSPNMKGIEIERVMKNVPKN